MRLLVRLLAATLLVVTGVFLFIAGDKVWEVQTAGAVVFILGIWNTSEIAAGG